MNSATSSHMTLLVPVYLMLRSFIDNEPLFAYKDGIHVCIDSYLSEIVS